MYIGNRIIQILITLEKEYNTLHSQFHKDFSTPYKSLTCKLNKTTLTIKILQFTYISHTKTTKNNIFKIKPMCNTTQELVICS